MLSFYRIASVIWTMLIIIGSFLPGKDLPEVSLFQVDKLVHIVFYAVLTFLLQKSLPSTFQNYISIFIICSVLGITIEILQPIITPDRRFDEFDILANGIGVLLSSFLNNKINTKLK